MSILAECEDVLRQNSAQIQSALAARDLNILVSSCERALHATGLFHRLHDICSPDVQGVCKDSATSLECHERGRDQFKNARHEDAAIAFGQSLKNHSINGDGKQRAAVLLANRALCLLKMKPPGAPFALLFMLQNHALRADTRILLCKVQIQNKGLMLGADPRRALEDSNHALHLDGSNAKALHRKLQALLDLGQCEEAHDCAKASLEGNKLKPNEAREVSVLLDRALATMAGKISETPAENEEALSRVSTSCLELAKTSEEGRHWVAARDIQDGETVLEEMPHAAMLTRGFRKSVRPQLHSTVVHPIANAEGIRLPLVNDHASKSVAFHTWIHTALDPVSLLWP